MRIANARNRQCQTPVVDHVMCKELQKEGKKDVSGDESWEKPNLSVNSRQRNRSSRDVRSHKSKLKRESEDNWLRFDTDENERDIESGSDDFDSRMDRINNRLEFPTAA